MTQGHKIALTVGVILIPFNPPLGLAVIALTVYDSRREWK
jgi:hypothetical protein